MNVTKSMIIAALLMAPGAAYACDSKQCDTAVKTVRAYVTAQLKTVDYDDDQSWIGYTQWRTPPQWDTATIVKDAAYPDATCNDRKCIVRVQFQCIGITVPYHSFHTQIEKRTLSLSLTPDGSHLDMPPEFRVVSPDAILKVLKAVMAVKSPNNSAETEQKYQKLYGEMIDQITKAAAK